MFLRILFSIMCSAPFWLCGQEELSLHTKGMIPGVFRYHMPDELGNLWALTESGQIKKFNASLDSVGVFNEVKRYGKLHSITSNNPLQALFFFREYRTILIVDRMLQTVGKVDLRKANLFQVSLVEQSYDNAIWVYEEQEAKIIRLDLQGKELMRTADLRIAVADNFKPSAMLEVDGNLYLYDPNKGLFVFDFYGALKKKIALLGWTNICRQGNSIVGLSGGKFQIYRLDKFDATSFNVPAVLGNGSHVRFTADGCFNLEQQGIIKYTWKK